MADKSIFDEESTFFPTSCEEQTHSKPEGLVTSDSPVTFFHCEGVERCGLYEIAKIPAFRGELPRSFVSYSELAGKEPAGRGVVCFENDAILRRLVRHPEQKLEALRHFSCVAEPDLSIRVGDPLSDVISACTYSHEVAAYFVQCGLRVIPTMKWGDRTSFSVCFDGYEEGGAVLVSTIGVSRDSRSKVFFHDGFLEMLRRIKPDCVLLYGDRHAWIDALIPEGLDVRYYSHERFNRMRGYGK